MGRVVKVPPLGVGAWGVRDSVILWYTPLRNPIYAHPRGFKSDKGPMAITDCGCKY